MYWVDVRWSLGVCCRGCVVGLEEEGLNGDFGGCLLGRLGLCMDGDVYAGGKRGRRASRHGVQGEGSLDYRI